jgi:hypothetical protein
MFHRIYESMELGMRPTSLYPRRNRFAPNGEALSDVARSMANPPILGVPDGIVKSL